MSYQRKLFIIIVLITLVTSVAIIRLIENTQKKAIKNYKVERVSEEGISFDIPLLFEKNKIKIYKSNGWLVKEYPFGKVGIFRVCYATGKKSFKQLATKYFNLEKYPENGRKLVLRGKPMFYMEVPLFDNGAYVVRKKGKRVIYIYFFTINSNLYWFDFTTNSTLNIYKSVFDNILLSIKSDRLKRKLKSTEFRKKINSVCLKSYFLLCQSVKVVIIFPTLITIIILFIIFWFMKLGGKLPDDEFFAGDFPVYKEENINFQIKTGFNNKVSTGAIAITGKNIYLFYFKKPMFIIPKDAKDIKITGGKSFFGGKYIQIESSNTNYFLKGKVFAGLYSNRNFKLRLFSKNIEGLANLLGVNMNPIIKNY